MYKNYLNPTNLFNTLLQKSKHQKNHRKKTTFLGLEIRAFLYLLLFGFLFSNNLFSQTTVDFSTPGNGSWVVPCGVTSVTVEIWGGGGSGGGSRNNADGGSGGGGGGYSSKTFTVSAGQTIDYTVGSGGIGRSNYNNTNGENTTLTHTPSGSSLAANGGDRGITNPGGTVTGGTGGSASGGTTNIAGNNGSDGLNNNNIGGNGGDSGNAPGTGGNGQSNDNGDNGTAPGGGGGGGERGNANGNGNAVRAGGDGGDGQVKITYTVETYLSELVSMSYGSSNWCTGETRNVTVQIKNIGTATWTDSSPDINIGVKWNNWADYYVRVNAGNLAPGATGTYVLPITAKNSPTYGPIYTTDLPAGNNNLTFDVVYEAVSWFGNNNSCVGPGNTVFISPNINIIGLPNTPNNPTSNSPQCSNTGVTLTRNGTPPAGQTWYWQGTNANGTSTANSGATFNASTTGTYYIRSRNSNGCWSTGSGSVAVVINPFNTVSSASSSPTLCANTSLTAITHTTTIATGIANDGVSGANGLPAGVSATWASNTITISGTPTETGTFNYSIPLTGGCGSVNATGTITVNEVPTITLSSAPATTNQTICINTAATNITYTIGGSATGASVTGLPAGITGNFSAGVFTISGTPTVAGTFNYTVTTFGGLCPAVALGGTIIVRPLSTMILASAASTTNQTTCRNTAITNIRYTIGGSATGVTLSGTLPAGVNGSLASGVYTISGTPTNTGTFSYSLTTTGGCLPNVTLGGTITVNQIPTITLSSAPATTNQSICINTAATNITYTIGGSGTGASVTGLPAGVISSFSSGVFTISGTPTAAGTFNYTVTTSGGLCANATATGTIIVKPVASTISLTSGASTTNQNICNNSALTNITYAIGGSATGASVSGLPTGVSGVLSGNIFTISGTPSVFGVFNYTVSTTGGCSSGVTANGTITVKELPVVSAISNITSCTGISTPSIIFSSSMSGSTYNWTSSANVGFGTSGSGNIGVFTTTNNTANTVVATISVRATNNGCQGPATTFTVTVYPSPTVNAITNLTYCNGVSAPAINFGSATAGVTYDWTSSVDVGFGTSGTGNIPTFTTDNGTATNAITTVSVRATINGCQGSARTFTITVRPTPIVNAIADLTYCRNIAAPAINFSSTTAGVSYAWTSTANVGFGTSGTGNIGGFTTTNTTANPITATVTVNAIINGCSGPSTTFTVTVNPTPLVNALPNLTYCNGNTAPTIAFASSTTGVTYSWTSNLNVGFGTSGIGDIPSFTAINTTATAITATVSVRAIIDGCLGTIRTFTIRVNPSPIVNAKSNLSYCNNASAPTITFASTTTGTVTYSWTSSINVGFGLSGTGNISAFTAVNATANPITTTVSVTATAATCTGPPTTFTVTVNPTPVVDVLPNLSYCFGANAPLIDFTSATTGVTYAWTSSVNIGFGTSGSGDIPAFTTTNSGTTVLTTTVSVRATINGCQGALRTFTIAVSPSAVVNAKSNLTYCPNASAPAITFASTTTGVTFAWTSSLDVGFGTSGTGNIPAFTATNSTASAVIATVSVSAVINGCSGVPTTFTVRVDTFPIIDITSDYCSVPGKVQLIATSNIAGTTWLWSTGQTGSTINVDIVGLYTVTGTTPAGCSSNSSINVANELVTDGSFTNFNAASPSFFTEYSQRQGFYTGGSTGLLPEGTYAVNINANSNTPTPGMGYHPAFYGRDHTNNSVGARNFLMVNGSSTTIPAPPGPNRQRIIWQQTVTVTPGTSYYFSAWGMNLNPGSPARLQFEVNGVAVGSIADLSLAPKPTSDSAINLANWIRFYSDTLWNSGTATTAIIRIVNLNTDPGGNDFGIDDISFGTLVPFVKLTSASGTDAQTVCQNYNITPISYAVGGGISGPSVTGLPSGITQVYTNGTLTLSGIPTVSGTFNYSVSTTGTCATVTVNGTIIVKPTPVQPTMGTVTHPTCTTSTGSFTITNYNSGYTYAITPSTGVTRSGATITAPAGNYTVTATLNGCISVASAVTTVNTQPTTPAQPTLSAATQPNCTNVTGSFTITNYDSNYTYSVTPSTGVSISGNTVTAPAGNYTVRATLGACTSVASASRTIDSQPATTSQPTLGSVTQPTCTTATGSFTITNYNASYTYTASPSSGVSISGSTITAPVGTYTITATLGACTSVASESATVVSSAKTWNGSVSSDWNNASNWTPVGIPTATQSVFIPNTARSPIISSAALSCSLTVQNGANLQVASNYSITVTNDINVNTGSQFLLEDSASLIQINNVANTVDGTFSMTRITQPMYRYDYTYWGSPLTFSSNYSLNDLTPLTRIDKYYSWIPSDPTNSGIGNWKQESRATIMNPEIGYIARAPDTYSTDPSTKSPYAAVFTGIPNNGDIAVPVSCGTLGNTTQDDKWNLLGNPYPSAINVIAFLNANTNIEGNVSLWTHGTPPSASNPQPFYGTFTYNYSDNDMLIVNGSGSVPGGFQGNIASGQGFMVSMLPDCTGTTSSVNFTNSMRSSTYGNSNFYKSNKQTDASEKNRIWLSMVDKNKTATSTMVGYIEGATNNNDRLYDALADIGSTMKIYSLLDKTPLTIQGRALPFDANEIIPLGMKIVAPGNYSIAIDQLDGLFDTQAIYLEDKLMNVIHDIKVKQYDFISDAGTFNDRFLIRYNTDNNPALNVNNSNLSVASIIALINKDKINVQASENIKKVQVFDIAGKLIKTYSPKNSSKTFIDDFQFSDGVYFAKIKLENGATKDVKLANGEY